MSAISKQTDDGENSLGWAQRHREELEREAASDAPHAWVAERILQRLDEDDVGDEESGES